jgi:Zn-dependent protease with chaperone function
MVTENNHVPWCERCEHNLDVFPPDPQMGPIARAYARWETKAGYRLNRRLFNELSARESWRPRIAGSHVILSIISIVVLTAMVAGLAGGVLLIIRGPGLVKLGGVLLILLVLVLRPRLGRLKHLHTEYDELSRGDAPHLFALVDRACDALGAKRIDRLFLSPEWNAFADTVGLRRTRVLMLGVPLWVCLRPQERVFVLGHELGHFINGDPRRGLFTRAGCTVFGDLADLVRPVQMVNDEANIVLMIVKAVRYPFQWALSYLFLGIHLAITMVAARESQRSEYHADAMALSLAGDKAATALDVLGDTFTAIVASRARGGHGYTGWAEAVEQTRTERESRLGRLRQLTQRIEASPLRSHPPRGLRHRMSTVGAYRDPKIVLTEAEVTRIDAELRRFESRYATVVAHSW